MPYFVGYEVPGCTKSSGEPPDRVKSTIGLSTLMAETEELRKRGGEVRLVIPRESGWSAS